MAELHILTTVADQEKKDCVEVLEELLAEAKTGSIQSILIAIVRPDTSMGYTWSSGTAAMMLGAINALEHAFLTEEIDRPDSK